MRDILKKAHPSPRRKRHEVRLHREAPDHLAGGMARRCIGRVSVGLPIRRLWMGHRLPPIREIPRGVLAFPFTCEREE